MNNFALSHASMHFVRITHKTCWTFLRVYTTEGRIGEGEASLQGKEDELQQAAARLVPLLLGGEYQGTDFAPQHSAQNIQDAAIVSALDQSLLSLHSQGNAESLAQSLGVQRQAIPVYANINRRTEQRGPEGFAQSARTAMSAGHTAFKLAPFDEVNTSICAQGDGESAMQAGLERIAAVREAVGPEARLMVDCHWRFDETTAILLNEATARLGVYWIETPLPEELGNIPALARLRRQCNALDMRQAGLEMSIGWQTLRPYCEGGAYDVVMPDMKYIGGIAEVQHTADACAALNVQVSPHNPSGPICHAASLQVSATLGAFDMLELQFDESPLFDELVDAPFAPIKDGHTVLPVGPGLGVSLNEEVLRRHADRPEQEWLA